MKSGPAGWADAAGNQGIRGKNLALMICNVHEFVNDGFQLILLYSNMRIF